MNELINSKNDIKTLHMLTQNYSRLWARKEVDFWNELYNRVNKMTINKTANKDNDNFFIDLFCDKEEYFKYNINYDEKIDIICEKRHHDHYSSFGLFLEIEYKSHYFEITLSQKDNYYSNIQIDLRESSDDYKRNKVLDSLLEENSYITNCKDIEYPDLTFYAKGVTEPTFDIFDDDRFNYFLTEYTKEMKKAILMIENHKSEIL